MNFISSLLIILATFTNPIDYAHHSDFELIIFEGSDWCAKCRRLEKEVLSDSIFLNYLDKHDIKLTKVDFPQRKKISKMQEQVNKEYAEKYNFDGNFPTIILSRTDRLSYEKLINDNQDAPAFTKQISDLLKKIE